MQKKTGNSDFNEDDLKALIDSAEYRYSFGQKKAQSLAHFLLKIIFKYFWFLSILLFFGLFILCVNENRIQEFFDTAWNSFFSLQKLSLLLWPVGLLITCYRFNKWKKQFWVHDLDLNELKFSYKKIVQCFGYAQLVLLLGWPFSIGANLAGWENFALYVHISISAIWVNLFLKLVWIHMHKILEESIEGLKLKIGNDEKIEILKQRVVLFRPLSINFGVDDSSNSKDAQAGGGGKSSGGGASTSW